jgi:hypothetical protein
MATYFSPDRCAAIFKERILPSFPQAEERFERYFKPSCEFIRAMPLHGYFKNVLFRRDFRRAVWYPKAVWDKRTFRCGLFKKIPDLLMSDIEVGMAALGIKPVTIQSRKSGASLYFYLKKHGKSFLEEIGLQIMKFRHRRWEDTWIFDPVLVSHVLSYRLNLRIRPEDAARILYEIHRYEPLPHYILGYPEMLQYREDFGLKSYSEGEFYGIPFRGEEFACAVSTPELIVPSLEAWASVTALIGEIEDLGSTISHATLYHKYDENKRRILAKVSIERHPGKDEWTVNRHIGNGQLFL